MTQQHRFLTALRRLQDWHADSVKAQTLESQSTGKPESRILQAQHHGFLFHWLKLWKYSRDDDDREKLIEELEDMVAARTKRPQVEAYKDHWNKTRYRKVRADAV